MIFLVIAINSSKVKLPFPFVSDSLKHFNNCALAFESFLFLSLTKNISSISSNDILPFLSLSK
jgi:hypothetical protein